jgi:hypothetical protein
MKRILKRTRDSDCSPVESIDNFGEAILRSVVAAFDS